MRKTLAAGALVAALALGGCGVQGTAPGPIAETQESLTAEDRDKAVQIYAFMRDPVMSKAHYCRDMYQSMVEAFNDRTEDRGDELSQYAERISEASDEIAAVDRDALPDYLASGYVWLKGAAENYSRAADALVEAHSLNAQGKVTEANDKVHDADFSADAALDGIAKARDHFESELMGEF